MTVDSRRRKRKGYSQTSALPEWGRIITPSAALQMAGKWVKFEKKDKELWNIQNVYDDKKHLKEMQNWMKTYKEPRNSTKFTAT